MTLSLRTVFIPKHLQKLQKCQNNALQIQRSSKIVGCGALFNEMRVAILDTEVGPIDQSQVLKVDTQGNIGYVVFPPQSKFWKLQLSASMLGCPYKAIQPEGLSRVSLSTKVAR